MKNQDYPSEEYKLLQSLKPLMHFKKTARYPMGMGDDAAIRLTKTGERLVFTADTMVENVHFSLSYMTFREVGFKAMAANLSDVAAMGAVPDAALVQIVFPENQEPRAICNSLRSLYEGLNKACRTWHFPIIGGNLSRGPSYIVDITLIGRAGNNNRLLLRKGVKKGDALWVTGFPGSSAAGLSAIKKWGSRKNIPRKYWPLVHQHIQPIPRIEAGRALAQNPYVHAMIDLSDGIAKECHTLAFENRWGIILEPQNTAIVDPLKEIGTELHYDRLKWFLFGGEDYELLFAASPQFDPSPLLKKGFICMTRIGTFSSSVKGVHLRLKNGKIIKVEKSGWDNLRKDLA